MGGHLRTPGTLSSHSNTLPLPNKQENPPSAAVRPYTPDLSDGPAPVLQKPQTLAASSIYSMYTQQATPGKGYQASGQGTLTRSQPRGDAPRPHVFMTEREPEVLIDRQKKMLSRKMK